MVIIRAARILALTLAFASTPHLDAGSNPNQPPTNARPDGFRPGIYRENPAFVGYREDRSDFFAGNQRTPTSHVRLLGPPIGAGKGDPKTHVAWSDPLRNRTIWMDQKPHQAGGHRR
jgi:hypothetical protein